MGNGENSTVQMFGSPPHPTPLHSFSTALVLSEEFNSPLRSEKSWPACRTSPEESAWSAVPGSGCSDVAVTQ